MQKQYLNYIEQDKNYLSKKRVFESLVALVLMPFYFVVLFFFVFRKMISNKDIFVEEKYFLNENIAISLKVLNTNFLLLKKVSLIYYVFLGEIDLVGVALVSYDKSIPYSYFQKPGVFSLWFIRSSLKMPNYTIRSSNNEYLEARSIKKDISIILKSIIASIFYIDRIVIKEKVKLFDVSFHNLNTQNVLDFIKDSINKKVQKTIFFINADCLNKTFSNKEYEKNLNEADMVLADGSGVNLACKMLKTPLKENLNGTDLFPHICNLSQENSYRIFMLGAAPGVALQMKEKLIEKYPNLQIVGTSHGFIKEHEELNLIKKINSLRCDILFVAMGAPLQEAFIKRNKNRLNTKILIAVGGLFDFYSNRIRRAPLFLRELGLEWIYRMIQEPKRMWKRYILGNPLFLLRVLRFKKQSNLEQKYLNTYEKPKTRSLGKIVWQCGLTLQNFLKRVTDIVCSFILIILFMPLFLVVAICIRYESKGAVLFSQNRVGRKGKLFKMYKFRSMIQNAEELKKKLQEQNESKDGVIFKMKDDPRITKVGKFIRKTSIDELPQLFNVLIGDMSLVGPRPPVMSEVVLYDMNDKKRLDVKPGITCIWQVSGRSNIPFKQQVEMDKEYIKRQSFYKDIMLLLKTIPAVLFQKGSY